jgi:hypothetical protein
MATNSALASNASGKALDIETSGFCSDHRPSL